MGRMKKLLYAIAEHAAEEIRVAGPLFMDVLIVRVRRQITAPTHFEWVDAGVRLAIDEGWLELADGKIGLSSPPPAWHSWQIYGP